MRIVIDVDAAHRVMRCRLSRIRIPRTGNQFFRPCNAPERIFCRTVDIGIKIIDRFLQNGGIHLERFCQIFERRTRYIARQVIVEKVRDAFTAERLALCRIGYGVSAE